MPEFSQHSLNQLSSCDERLQGIFAKTIKIADCRVLIGHRDEKAQDEAFRQNKSKVMWPHSKHNRIPSLAADVAPYPVIYYQKAQDRIRGHWKALARWYLFAGIVLGIAQGMAISLRWGGMWNRSEKLWIWENRFDDLAHFELWENRDQLLPGQSQGAHVEI